jgi:serine phosphatase RsbU (regulator of sigma subunit)
LSKHQLALGTEEMFTAIYAIIDPSAGTISWANAGHPPPLLMSAAGETRYLTGSDGLMGFEDVRYGDLEAPLGASDVLVFYTDGLIERRGESLEAGLQRLAEAAASGPPEPSALRHHVLDRLLPAGGERNDDVTAVFAKLTQSSSA